jgi:shikimate dehydrogenase
MYYTALIGNPTRHSVSHVMYEQLVRAAGVDRPYRHIKIDVASENLEKAINALQALGFMGLNVTLPHKLAVMSTLDDSSDAVKELGAVNTISLNGKVIGHNTDWEGLYLPVLNTGKAIKNVAIFGSGGAARAAIYAAKQLGAKNISVFYRHNPMSKNTKDLMDRAKELGISMCVYSNIQPVLNKSELIINATSAGMVGKDKLPFDLKYIDNTDVSKKIYFDAVFNPINTPLADYFSQKGAHVIDGLWMMIYQGVAALRIWLNKDVFIEEKELQRIHDLLIEELGNV